ncbi:MULTISPECIES: tripartite tricarboxylate transporter substrate-binding protein [unclassified Variovorax]|uniref:Bug family tripartite tricarboxylate transporter substrate binding protein n=1 Tax=unclassified Variovorax TaxID=663243 RepID=UPI00257783F4|nr:MULTISPECIES: tripartite tricarboxylate transporter substrate-binding protein [unclassified Variovorax]MDM0086981.1 tripartite tricarboxylate transporter substrate-binding protein [Variovorax sp. J22G40]MDM0144762.1 tripartite tricarboxylate transporter substrate-binding protein [Variovorax sp. J2P1-31]
MHKTSAHRARGALRLAALAVLASVGIGLAGAQEAYPNRPIRVVVPYPAGGNTDIIARDVMKEVSARLGQPVVIDNKPGANSILGTDLVVKAAPDGYTLLVVIGAYANNEALYRSLPYKPADLAPVAQLTRTSLVLVTARPGLRTLDDLVRSGGDAGAPQSFASSGVGSAAHLLGERFARTTGMKGTMHVPYKGTADATTDLVSGRVGFMFDAISAMGPHIRPGKLTALAVTGQDRSPLLPEVPSLKELGHPELVAYAWAGVMAPARTPPAIVQRLAGEIASVMKGAELRTRLAAISTEPVGSTPAEFARFIAQEAKVNGDLIRQLQISLD